MGNYLWLRVELIIYQDDLIQNLLRLIDMFYLWFYSQILVPDWGFPSLFALGCGTIILTEICTSRHNVVDRLIYPRQVWPVSLLLSAACFVLLLRVKTKHVFWNVARVFLTMLVVGYNHGIFPWHI